MATIHLREQTGLQEKFIQTFGEALLEWSYVESRLSWWFGQLTSLPAAMARAVFFSSRSFQGRSEMLAAVISARVWKDKLDDEAKSFIGAALAKAKLYSGRRNALAHGHAVEQATEQGAEPILVQGRDYMPEKHSTLRQRDLSNVAKNFELLANLLSRSVRAYQAENLSELQKCYSELILLPNVPTALSPSRNQAGRLRQQKAATRRQSK